jgi:predicted amidohydrolase YtcJ
MVFLRCIVSIVIVFGLLVTTIAHATELIIHNAKVYTADDQQSLAEAVVAVDGRIIYVGDSVTALQYKSSTSHIIDANGMALLPGFVDSHNHVFEGASEVGGACQLAPDKTLDQQGTELQNCQHELGEAGEWLIGYGYQLDALWGSADHLNAKSKLDELFPEHPVIIMEKTSHSMLVNSLALAAAGFNKDSSNPKGGTIMVGVDGEPNGVLFDNAGDIVMEIAWNSLKDNFKVSYNGLMAGMNEAVKNGITTIGDGRLYWRRGWYEVWQQALKNNAMVTRVSLRPWVYPDVAFEDQLPFMRRIASPNKNALIIVDQVKLYIDGVIHFGTAKVSQPYMFSWQQDLPYGLNYIAPHDLPTLLSELDRSGYGAHIHAIGDAGVTETLDAIEQARQQGSHQIYSITHLEMVDEADFKRFKELNVTADFQAGGDFFADTMWATDYVGHKRASLMLPMREIYDHGANVSFSSDWTVNSINPLMAIANSQRLRHSRGLPDIHAAIKAATINGAKALGLDAVTGSIEVGKSADLVMLSQDITQLSADEIEGVTVLQTILQGRMTYQR